MANKAGPYFTWKIKIFFKWNKAIEFAIWLRSELFDLYFKMSLTIFPRNHEIKWENREIKGKTQKTIFSQELWNKVYFMIFVTKSDILFHDFLTKSVAKSAIMKSMQLWIYNYLLNDE